MLDRVTAAAGLVTEHVECGDHRIDPRASLPPDRTSIFTTSCYSAAELQMLQPNVETICRARIF